MVLNIILFGSGLRYNRKKKNDRKYNSNGSP